MLLCCIAFTAHAAEEIALRTVQVTGSHQMQVVPDIAYVDLTVYAKAQQHAEAKQKADALLRAVKGAASAMNIAEKHIKSQYVTVNPLYEYIDNRQKLVGYEASYTLQVTVERLDDVGAVVERFVSVGVDRINNVRYAIKDDEAARLMVLNKAVENAKMKAETLARAAGVTVGKAVTINENGGGYVTPVYMARSAMAMEGVSDKMSGEVPPKGELDVQASVNIVFEIE
jgi:uncharacterized protein YggE